MKRRDFTDDVLGPSPFLTVGGWVIEMRSRGVLDEVGSGSISYWQGPGKMYCWWGQVESAIRFYTKADAEEVISRLDRNQLQQLRAVDDAIGQHRLAGRFSGTKPDNGADSNEALTK